MCAVSMINDHYGNHPGSGYGQFVPSIPWGTGLPTGLPWSPESLNDLKEILKRLDELDKKLGLAHCEDPKKAEWLKGLEKRVKKLEKASK